MAPCAMASLREQLLRRKPVAAMAAETGTDTERGELARSIGLFQLSMIGVGATIGTGIFFVLGQAVPVAGPPSSGPSSSPGRSPA
jgi:basic amino acid/polyamine antiporter, APA family